MVAVALELEHAVDEVLEHARPGDRAVLRHVPDEDRRDTLLLGDAEEPSGRLAHLGDRARGRAELRRRRASAPSRSRTRPAAPLERGAHGLELGLGEDLDVLGAAEPSARSLTCATDSSPVTRSARRPARETLPSAAEQERRLARRPARRRRARATRARARRRERGRARARPCRSGRLLRADVGEPGRRPRHAAAPLRGRRRPDSSSTSVPNAPQPGHCPSHRPVVVPHSLQTCWTITLAMTRW